MKVREVTEENMHQIPDHIVYGWVRTGVWKPKDFFKWLKLRNKHGK